MSEQDDKRLWWQKRLTPDGLRTNDANPTGTHYSALAISDSIRAGKVSKTTGLSEPAIVACECFRIRSEENPDLSARQLLGLPDKPVDKAKLAAEIAAQIRALPDSRFPLAEGRDLCNRLADAVELLAETTDGSTTE